MQECVEVGCDLNDMAIAHNALRIGGVAPDIGDGDVWYCIVIKAFVAKETLYDGVGWAGLDEENADGSA